jgi:hypothetical protein
LGNNTIFDVVSYFRAIGASVLPCFYPYQFLEVFHISRRCNSNRHHVLHASDKPTFVVGVSRLYNSCFSTFPNQTFTNRIFNTPHFNQHCMGRHRAIGNEDITVEIDYDLVVSCSINLPVYEQATK